MYAASNTVTVTVTARLGRVKWSEFSHLCLEVASKLANFSQLSWLLDL